MSGLTLLAVGGPRHGEQLPYREGQRELRSPVMPSLKTWSFRPYCVHGGRVRSATDGQLHHVPAPEVARLYRLQTGEYKLAGPSNSPTHLYGHVTDENCLFPDPLGRYEVPHLGQYDVTIRVDEYVARSVSDRLCWVYVGRT